MNPENNTNISDNTGTMPTVTNPTEPVLTPSDNSVVSEPTSSNSTSAVVDPSSTSSTEVNPSSTTPTMIDPSQFGTSAPPPVITPPSLTPTIPVEIKEKPKKEIEYTPLSKGKTILLVLFFVVLIAFVIFLPQISSFTRKLMRHELNVKEEKIETGRLICSYATTTTNLDKNYEMTFTFSENKLKTTRFEIVTRGDVTLDDDVLDGLRVSCKQLEENVENMDGVSVRCEYSSGTLTETQSFDLEKVNMDDLSSAFVEAGGNMPEYQFDEDIDYIEKNMNASGYTCEREKN